MSIRRSYSLTIQVQGSAPQCIESVSLSENTFNLPSLGSDASWKESRLNLQRYSLALTGVDRGGYASLRTIKRAKTKLTWTLQSDDLEINQTGSGYVLELSRDHAPGREEAWSCLIEGDLNPVDV